MTILHIVPLAADGRNARILKPSEKEDGYGTVREWDDAFGVFATIYPSESSQAPTEDGLEPAVSVKIQFCLPAGASVASDDRIRVGDDTYRLTDIRDYGGSIAATGVRL